MDANQRMERLDNLRANTKPYSEMEVLYKGKRKMPVYTIDLDWLIYNKYNGRIASMIKSYESQFGQLNPENEDHKKKIEQFLWDSKEARNRHTMKDLQENGQLKYGIVTRDGIIIDGNRRASLLNRIANEGNKRPAYFNAVILDERLDQNPREIMRLETTYQMGEDEKLEYNAIEKYLKCKDLRDIYKFKPSEIGTMMGELESQIKEWLEIMALMDEYLASLHYDGIYTALEGTEGPFVDVTAYLQRYAKGNSEKVKWEYSKQDVNDLKLIYFDYIRARHTGEGKDYRLIGKPSKDGIFCNEKIWEEFRDRHFATIEPISKDEPSIDDCKKQYENVPLDKVLEQRDKDWGEKVKPSIQENMGRSRRALEDFKSKNEPQELLTRALNSLRFIDPSRDEFLKNPAIAPLVSELNTIIWDFQKTLQRNRHD